MIPRWFSTSPWLNVRPQSPPMRPVSRSQAKIGDLRGVVRLERPKLARHADLSNKSRIDPFVNLGCRSRLWERQSIREMRKTTTRRGFPVLGRFPVIGMPIERDARRARTQASGDGCGLRRLRWMSRVARSAGLMPLIRPGLAERLGADALELLAGLGPKLVDRTDSRGRSGSFCSPAGGTARSARPAARRSRCTSPRSPPARRRRRAKSVSASSGAS